MEIKVLNDSKDEIEIEIESLTFAELFREYLNGDSGVTFVAWRREHPTKSPILKIKTKGKTAKKALNDAIAKIEKELDKVADDFVKMK